jgi:kumamolisin
VGAMGTRAGIELAGSVRTPVPSAGSLGPAPANERARVTVLLRRGSAPGAFPSLAEIEGGGFARRQRWSREGLARTHGARGDDLAAVGSFLESSGLTDIEASAARRTVSAEGSVAVVARAFGTSLARFASPVGTFRAREGPLRIPANLDGIVLGVFGLDTRPQAVPHFRPRPDRAVSDPSYPPPEVAAAYDFPTGLDGTGECIGLVELGGGYRPSDLTTYFASVGVTAPSVTAVSVDGGANAPTGSSNGPDGEVELDLEVAGSCAPGARLVAYFAPNTDQGFLDALSTAVHDTTNRPTIVSVSWGGPEPSWTLQARNAFASVFEDAAALGVTVLVAAGDQGATDGSPNGALTVDFPASSPGAVGCGGTHLAISGGADAGESVWNELARGEGATGGGVSEAFALPSYQTGIGVPAAPNGFVGRGVPDVAGDADPVTGYSVLVDGQATVLGGTSAVAPLWAALVARINQSLGTPVGYVNPALYRLLGSAAFRAITSGGNDGYSAGPGWNACTGLGPPVGTALLDALRSA